MPGGARPGARPSLASLVPVLALALALAPPAAAVWTAAGGGPGAARADVLGAAPSVTAACGALGEAQLSWATVTRAASYSIERSTGGGAWTPVATSASTSATVAAPLSTHRWRVVAAVHAWTGAPSPPSNPLTVGAGQVCV